MKQAKSYVNQQTLFPVKEVIELDIIKGREERDEGMERAGAKADKDSPGWQQRAYEFLQAYIKEWEGNFMSEEVRKAAEQQDFPLPENPKAWGPVFNKAAREGIILSVGFAAVKNKNAHCRPGTVWRKVV